MRWAAWISTSRAAGAPCGHRRPWPGPSLPRRRIDVGRPESLERPGACTGSRCDHSGWLRSGPSLRGKAHLTTSTRATPLSIWSFCTASMQPVKVSFSRDRATALMSAGRGLSAGRVWPMRVWVRAGAGPMVRAGTTAAGTGASCWPTGVGVDGPLGDRAPGVVLGHRGRLEDVECAAHVAGAQPHDRVQPGAVNLHAFHLAHVLHPASRHREAGHPATRRPARRPARAAASPVADKGLRERREAEPGAARLQRGDDLGGINNLGLVTHFDVIQLLKKKKKKRGN